MSWKAHAFILLMFIFQMWPLFEENNHHGHNGGHADHLCLLERTGWCQLHEVLMILWILGDSLGILIH